MAADFDSLGAGIPIGATVATYVAKRWGRGVRTLPPVGIGVNSSGVQLCKNNPRRFLLAIASTDGVLIRFGYLPRITFFQPFVLPPSGGSCVILVDEDGEMVTYDWYAITPSGASTVNVVEVETI